MLIWICWSSTVITGVKRKYEKKKIQLRKQALTMGRPWGDQYWEPSRNSWHTRRGTCMHTHAQACIHCIIISSGTMQFNPSSCSCSSQALMHNSTEWLQVYLRLMKRRPCIMKAGPLSRSLAMVTVFFHWWFTHNRGATGWWMHSMEICGVQQAVIVLTAVGNLQEDCQLD